MLPAEIAFNGVQFHLASAKTGTLNAVVAKGQTIALPPGNFNRVYLLAASANGDQKARFEVGSTGVELNVQDWSGFIGQWDDRQWVAKDTPSAENPGRTEHDDYAEMTGIKPGYIKRADLAWYCSHHHNAKGENVPYGYSYLFGYSIDMPPGAKTIRLPDNDKIRVLAISVANEDPELKPAQPLYDVLPPPASDISDFALSTSADSLSFPQGRSDSITVSVLPRGGFKGSVSLAVSGLPAGVKASFSPAGIAGTSTMTLAADGSASPAQSTLTITGASGSLTHTAAIPLTITAVAKGTVAVNLSTAYNAYGIYTDGKTFPAEASPDSAGSACSEQVLGSTQVGEGVLFKLGPANALDVVRSATVALPSGKFSSLRMLAFGVNGSQEAQVFTVTYADGTTSSFTQSLSDWNRPQGFSGESLAVTMPYRLGGDGSKDNRTFYIYGYSFSLDDRKEVRSITLPSNAQVLVFAMTLVPAAGGAAAP
jgi:alpha-mannosidase